MACTPVAYLWHVYKQLGPNYTKFETPDLRPRIPPPNAIFMHNNRIIDKCENTMQYTVYTIVIVDPWGGCAFIVEGLSHTYIYYLIGK